MKTNKREAIVTCLFELDDKDWRLVEEVLDAFCAKLQNLSFRFKETEPISNEL